MTKEQVIELLWLKAKKYDPSVRRAVIEGVIQPVWDEMVLKYVFSAPDMGYEFCKEYDFVANEPGSDSEEFSDSSSADSIMEYSIPVPYYVIHAISFKGGVFRIHNEQRTNFVPVRWNELRDLDNIGVNEIVKSGGVLYSVLDGNIYFLAQGDIPISGTIDFLISFKEYEPYEEIPMPISTRPDVSYQEIFVNAVLSMLFGEKPELKLIDDTNIP